MYIVALYCVLYFACDITSYDREREWYYSAVLVNSIARTILFVQVPGTPLQEGEDQNRSRLKQTEKVTILFGIAKKQ